MSRFRTFRGVTETLEDAVLEADFAAAEDLGIMKIGEQAVYSAMSPVMISYAPRHLIQKARYVDRPVLSKG